MSRLIASSDFRYGNRQLKAGDAFAAVSDTDRDILLRCGRATAEVSADAVAPGGSDISHNRPDPGSQRAGSGKQRNYKRRDMFAERNEPN